MKNCIFILLICLLQLEVSAQDSAINNDKFLNKENYNRRFVGEIVSIEGRINRIGLGYNNLPLIELEPTGRPGKFVWVSSILTSPMSHIKKGDIIRAQGYLHKLSKNEKPTRKRIGSKYLMLSYCYFNVSLKKAFYGHNDPICNEWNNKNIAEIGPSEAELVELGNTGDGKAFNTLGNRYLYGRGAEQDDSKAVSYYQRGTELGDLLAKVNLAYMYETGRGIKADKNQAFQLYSDAAREGDSGAMMNLGIMYAVGAVPDKNIIEGYKWFSIAFELAKTTGDNDVLRKAQAGMLAARSGMSNDELKEANENAEEWLLHHTP